MSFGFSIVNSAGVVQIDQDYANYGLAQSGTINVVAPASPTEPSSYTTVTFPNYGVIPLVFVRYGVVGHYVRLMGLTTTQFFIAINNGTDSFVSGTLQYRIYVPQNLLPQPAATYGLRVFRPDGSVAFNSAISPMVVNAVSNLPRPSSFGGGGTNPSVAVAGAPVNPFYCINSTMFWTEIIVLADNATYIVGSSVGYWSGALRGLLALVFFIPTALADRTTEIPFFPIMTLKV